jgi:hypothetical protein
MVSDALAMQMTPLSSLKRAPRDLPDEMLDDPSGDKPSERPQDRAEDLAAAPTTDPAAQSASEADSEPGWLRRLRQAAVQSPLVETRPTLAGLQLLDPAAAPKAVFVGIGLCTREVLSSTLPVDLVGLLLTAERARRALGATTLMVAVADVHARENEFDALAVRRRAQETEATLQRLGERLRLPRMRVVRASQFQDSSGYQRILQWVDEVSARDEHPYVMREAADIEYLNRQFGGLLKLGWTVSSLPAGTERFDEVAFDRRYQAWVGNGVGFVYAKAGRALDDRCPKVSPYTVTEPERRICLHPGEDVRAKLRQAEGRIQPSTIRGVRRHLTRITREFRDLVAPVHGDVESRIQQIIGHVLGG